MAQASFSTTGLQMGTCLVLIFEGARLQHVEKVDIDTKQPQTRLRMPVDRVAGNWVNKLAHYADGTGFDVLWPNARGLHSDAPLSFEDVFEAMEDVGKQYKIDASRVYLIGEREGAALALGLAESYPDRFAAAAVVNANSEPKKLPTAFWRSANSSYELAENLRNVPLLMIHGQLLPGSPSLQSQQFQAHLKKYGMESKLILLPGDTRWADEDPFRLSFEFFKGKARPEAPAEVTFVTGQLKHDSAYWLRITNMTQAAQMARVEAKFIAPDRVEAKTENVAGLEIVTATLKKIGLVGPFLRVSLNGVERKVSIEEASAELRSARQATKNDDLSYRKVSVLIHSPEVAPATASRLRKNHEVEGPVSHAFAGPFILVENSLGAPEEIKRENAIVEGLAKNWAATYYVPCRRKLDKEITDADIRDSNLIFVGTPESNTLLQRMKGQIPLKVEPARIQVGDASYEGQSLSATVVYPNPLNPRRYVVVTSSNDFSRFVLPQANPAQMAWYDVAVWQSDGRVFLKWAGYWDNTWSRLINDPAAVIRAQ